MDVATTNKLARSPVPKRKGFDSSLELLADPYRFIGRTCQKLGSDVFETRLQLRKTFCMTGPYAAQVFYDPLSFQREGAAPEPLQATLFGKGAVQGLDGARHLNRKAMFLSLKSPVQLANLEQLVRRAWEAAIPQWCDAGRIVLYRALQPVLTRAVCEWAGVPLADTELMLRTRQLTALFDAAASGVTNHLAARLARRRAEHWLTKIVEQARAGATELPPQSLAAEIVRHRDEQGDLLSPRIAAVELLNVLRPTVAVSVYITFVAHALHGQASWAEVLSQDLAAGKTRQALGFVQEVRRHYPFFPAVVAKVRTGFEWNGMHFPAGRRVMLDLYGTNHDARVWDEPHAFRPERWLYREPGRFDFVPQGGAEVATHHRCPGEDVVLRLMLLAVQMLLLRLKYDVPVQDLSIAFQRLPAIPSDGFVIDGVQFAR